MKKKQTIEKVVSVEGAKDLKGKRVFTDLFGNKVVFVEVEEESELNP